MKRLAPAALADPSWPAPLDTVGLTATTQLSHGSNPPAPRTTGKVRVEGVWGNESPEAHVGLVPVQLGALGDTLPARGFGFQLCKMGG